MTPQLKDILTALFIALCGATFLASAAMLFQL